MTRHEQTIDEHVRSNLACCLDLIDEHESPEDAELCWRQNTFDSCIADGYTGDEAFAAA